MLFNNQHPDPNNKDDLETYFKNHNSFWAKYTIPITGDYNIQKPAISETAKETPSIDSILQKDTSSFDIVGTFLNDKLYMFRSNIKLLKKLVENRSHIRDDHLVHLDYKIHECRNYLINLDAWPAFGNQMVESKRAGLGQAITHLETEKNIEKSRCWSDQSRLYQELQNVFTDYQALQRKNKLIGS